VLTTEPLENLRLGSLDCALARFQRVRVSLELRKPSGVSLCRLLVSRTTSLPSSQDLAAYGEHGAQHNGEDKPQKWKYGEGESGYAGREQCKRCGLEYPGNGANQQSLSVGRVADGDVLDARARTMRPA
jgi:hypothetical protein